MRLCGECPWCVAILCLSLGDERMFLQGGGVIGTPPPPRLLTKKELWASSGRDPDLVSPF